MVRRRLLVLLFSAAVAAQGDSPLRVLFFGNSFTHGAGSTRSVDELFVDIAVAAGHRDPFVRSAAVSGRDIRWHVENNTPVIGTLADEQGGWSFVVMQEHSTKLTRAYPDEPRFPGSVEQSKRSALRLAEVVKQHSPSAKLVLYETWARGPRHDWYDGEAPLFTDPSDMQAEVRTGYEALKLALDTAAGEEVALIAPVGDAWEHADYDALHAPDDWHAQNRGTLLAALVIYGTVYQDANTQAIDLSGVLSSLNLGSEDGAFLTAMTDEILARAPQAAPAATVSDGR